MIEIKKTKINTIVYYGWIEIETRVGTLEYSFQFGSKKDENYQLESTLSNYHELTDQELDIIDDLIRQEMSKMIANPKKYW